MPHHGQVIGWPQATVLPTYTVWLEAGVYYAMNNTTGAIDFQGADPAVVVQACLTAGGAGTKIGMREAVYVALTGVAATANNQSIYGMGRGTYWDATALLTGVHAFTISGFTGCGLRNFAIETLAGGTLVNHCVFIEDGADDFHLIDLIIVDSDSDGIHVEGTTITQGHIHRCHVEGADEVGIQVDMDAANFMYRLHIEDCDIGNCGTQGIYLATSGGNMYCEIINNIIYSCTAEGILVLDGDYSQIRGNICLLNTQEGIELNSTVRAQVLGNICYSNTRHGIFLVDSDYCTVEGNTCVENDSEDTATFSGISLDADSMRNMVLGNVCVGNHARGIYVLGAGNSVNSNVCAENDDHGIHILATECKINDNLCYHNGADTNNTRDGIVLSADADRCTVNGNTCYGDGTRQRHGIIISDGAIDCTVNGNICYNHATDGIRLDANNDNCIVNGNRCTGNTGWGINNLAATSDKCVIVGNQLLANTAGPLQDNGTATEAAHNVVA